MQLTAVRRCSKRDFAQPAQGVADVDGIGGLKVHWRQHRFFRRGFGLKQMTAKDSGKHPGAERRCQQPACTANKDVADRAFGDFASLVEEDYFIEAVPSALRVLHIVLFS